MKCLIKSFNQDFVPLPLEALSPLLELSPRFPNQGAQYKSSFALENRLYFFFFCSMLNNS